MPEQVSVRVLFFAAAREASGNVSSVELELPDPADTALLRYKRRKRSYHTCIINTLITRSCVSITPKGHNKTVLVGFSLYLPRITRLLALLSDVPFRLNSFFLSFFDRTLLAEKYPGLAALVSNEEYIVLALNEEYIPFGSTLPLKTGDVVALIPPISGG